MSIMRLEVDLLCNIRPAQAAEVAAARLSVWIRKNAGAWRPWFLFWVYSNTSALQSQSGESPGCENFRRIRTRKSWYRDECKKPSTILLQKRNDKNDGPQPKETLPAMIGFSACSTSWKNFTKAATYHSSLSHKLISVRSLIKKGAFGATCYTLP